MKISAMKENECGLITSLDKNSEYCRRLFDLGFSSGEEIKCVIKSPLGSPIAYKVSGAVIALRKCDADKVGVVL